MNEHAITLMKRGKPHEAIDVLRRGLRLRPNDPASHVNLAIAYEDIGDPLMAERGYRFVLAAWPGHVEAASNLANLLARTGRLSEAETLHRANLARNPDDAYSLTGLAMVQADQAKIEECVANLKRAAELTDHPAAWSEWLSYGLHLGYDEAGHKHWVERFAKPYHQPPPPVDYDGKRRIRVGYVSNTWGRHSVDTFILPILRKHNRDAVHVTLFGDAPVPTALAKFADNVVQLNGGDLSAASKCHRIDVLVDLDGHKRGSRLLAFATNPAPVQGTMNGYLPDTQLTENFNLGWAFEPHAEAPSIRQRPTAGRTFGSIHRAGKITTAVARVWSELLNEVPEATLVVFSRGGEANTRLRDKLQVAGVDGRRLQLVGPPIKMGAYLSLAMDLIDVHLDAWPFNGVTTTCDLMYQGIPTVTQSTRDAQGRTGETIATICETRNLVAQTDDQYVAIASRLIRDDTYLREFRTTARVRMLPLLNAHPLTDRLERLYRLRLHEAAHRPAAPRPSASIPLPGDIIESIAKRIGADRLAKWWEEKTGIPCGCEERKQKINAATEKLLRWIKPN